MLHEYIGNLHVHTTYSDGSGSHDQVALAAIRGGLDFVVVTDHNLWVDGIDGYRYADGRQVLLLAGEEVHDQTRQPQKNHLLIYEAHDELTPFGSHPKRLIDQVNRANGLSFIAHPVDPASPIFHEPDLSWVDWDIDGYTGLELWNFMSEFKARLTSWPVALYYAYNPNMAADGPFKATLKRWDALLADGKRVVVIGGADAHAFPVRLGPLKRVIFPYEFLFRAVNTHVLTSDPLTGDSEVDRRRLFHSIAHGRCFVGYDLPASTQGFRFSAQSDSGAAIMGDAVRARYGATLQIRVPMRTEIHLLRDGEPIRTWSNSDAAIQVVSEPGAYRVEVYIGYRGKRRGWIFSNPIYVLE